MKVAVVLLLTSTATASFAQSGTIYLANNCTYRSATDGATITLKINGNVLVNGKPSKLRCENADGVVTLTYNGKTVNHLFWNVDADGGSCLLKDDRGICYALVKCTGSR